MTTAPTVRKPSSPSSTGAGALLLSNLTSVTVTASAMAFGMSAKFLADWSEVVRQVGMAGVIVVLCGVVYYLERVKSPAADHKHEAEKETLRARLNAANAELLRRSDLYNAELRRDAETRRELDAELAEAMRDLRAQLRARYNKGAVPAAPETSTQEGG